MQPLIPIISIIQNKTAMRRTITKFLLPILMSILVFQELKAQTCYELVWSDEFNYTGLPDSTVWFFEEGGTGWGNNELQYYTSKRPENAYVEDGNLTITAREENYGGRNYTSARLITYQTGHSWQYGKIEARIKLPYGQGIWPAFWMLGDGIFEGTPWPGCGEIDIMEMVGGGEGKDDVVHGTMHYDDNGHAYYGGEYQLDQGIFADSFHTFSIEWTDTYIKWYMDGIEYHVASITEDYLTELHNEFFILLNIAVGGNWPGSPNSSTVFPQQMQVDYVRVYQMANEPAIGGDTLINRTQKNVTFHTPESEDFTYNWIVPDGVTITDGQGTHQIQANWGCNPDTVICEVTGLCDSYTLKLPVNIQEINLTGPSLVEAYATETNYQIAELDSTTYQWQVPDEVTFNGATDTNSVSLNWSTFEGYVKVTAQNQCGTENDSMYVSVVNQLPYPDSTTSHSIPGTIEATNYDFGGEGISYHDTDDINEGPGPRQEEAVDTEYNDGGANIGWIHPGEWVEYTVDVDSTGLYDIELRVASQPGGGQMEIMFNSEDRTGAIAIPSTGAWSSFTSIYLDDIQVFETDSIMRLNFSAGDFNISRLIFGNNSNAIDEVKNQLSLKVYPNPGNNKLFLRNQKQTLNYKIYSILGSAVSEGMLSPGDAISIDQLEKGTYFIRFYRNELSGTLRFIKN